VIRWSEGTPNDITRIRRLVQHALGFINRRLPIINQLVRTVM